MKVYIQYEPDRCADVVNDETGEVLRSVYAPWAFVIHARAVVQPAERLLDAAVNWAVRKHLVVERVEVFDPEVEAIR